MRKTPLTRALPLALLAFLALGCPNKPVQPLVLTEQLGTLPVQFSARQCRLPILSERPADPHEVIARIKTYGNPKTRKTDMDNMLRGEACALGAQALVVRPMQTGDFEDEISVQHLGYSTTRDYTSRAAYQYRVIGLAIRYTAAPPIAAPRGLDSVGNSP